MSLHHSIQKTRQHLQLSIEETAEQTGISTDRLRDFEAVNITLQDAELKKLSTFFDETMAFLASRSLPEGMSFSQRGHHVRMLAARAGGYFFIFWGIMGYRLAGHFTFINLLLLLLGLIFLGMTSNDYLKKQAYAPL